MCDQTSLVCMAEVPFSHARVRRTRALWTYIVPAGEVTMRIELEANERGRLWAEDPEAWKRPCTTEACPLCGEDPHPEWVLAETDICKISAWSEAVLPGYACVLSKRDVIEPFELEDHKQASFF